MKILASERLSEHKYKTPEGYLICTDAILARTGKQTYRKADVYGADCVDADEEIDVDRKYEEVFSKATLASFENKPITIEHPDEDVNINNYKDYAVGYVRNIREGDYEGNPVIVGDLVITDQKAIDLIESGEMNELSCGYDCDILDEDEPQQRNIRGNHLALCERGRAGIARIVDSEVEDMALSRADAMDRCISLGKKFIQHFDKIYQNPKDINVSHWIGEMKGWFNQVKEIRLKSNNKKILNGDLRDWFFTAGANPQDFMKIGDDRELELYDKFTTDIIGGKDMSTSLKSIKLIDSIKDDKESEIENYLKKNNKLYLAADIKEEKINKTVRVVCSSRNLNELFKILEKEYTCEEMNDNMIRIYVDDSINDSRKDSTKVKDEAVYQWLADPEDNDDKDRFESCKKAGLKIRPFKNGLYFVEGPASKMAKALNISVDNLEEVSKERMTTIKKLKDASYPSFLGYVNGTMKEFNPKELVDKVIERRQALHTNRIARATDNMYILYHIVVDPHGTSLENCKVYVDAVKETYIREDGDADDIRSYKFKETQDRVLMKDCGDGEDKWEKAIKILNDFKAKHLNDSVNDSVNIEDASKYIYLFAKSDISAADRAMMGRYGLEILGTNRFEREVNLAVKGDLGDLKRFCKEYMGYEMHRDYLYKENEFAGEITRDSVKDFNSDYRGFSIQVKNNRVEVWRNGKKCVETPTEEEAEEWIDDYLEKDTRDSLKDSNVEDSNDLKLISKFKNMLNKRTIKK